MGMEDIDTLFTLLDAYSVHTILIHIGMEDKITVFVISRIVGVIRVLV